MKSRISRMGHRAILSHAPCQPFRLQSWLVATQKMIPDNMLIGFGCQQIQRLPNIPGTSRQASGTRGIPSSYKKSISLQRMGLTLFNVSLSKVAVARKPSEDTSSKTMPQHANKHTV